MIEAAQEDIDRFFQYVEKLPNGCWFWSGARSRGKGNKKWYGSFKFKGRSIRAHRFASDILAGRGLLPKGYHRDHTCRFSLCVNPDHIETVPKEINQERRWLGKRLHERDIPGIIILDPGPWQHIYIPQDHTCEGLEKI